MALIQTVQKYLRFARVGIFLGVRQLRRGNVWINLLIVSIMVLTFLSMVVIPGILIGITEGSFKENREGFSGDVYVTTHPDYDAIINTQDLVRVLDNLPEVESYSVRYKIAATLESGYINRDDFSKNPERLSVNAYVVNPHNEEQTTKISDSIVEGQMLREGESGYIVIGSTLLKRYSDFADLFEPLEHVEIGDTIRVTLQGAANEGLDQDRALLDGDARPGQTSEFTVAGIIDSKVGEFSATAFITEQDYRRIAKKTSLQAAEIAIKHKDYISDTQFKKLLLGYDFDRYAKVRTATEAIPQFLSDIQDTFGLLGNLIGFIGIIVSSITVFIVIYINALTRRKFIGILKGIGISEGAIEFSYVVQSLFYAFVGIGLGLILVYGVLVPLFEKHPLDFPFSDGILVAKVVPTFVRAGILTLITMVAGLLPARLIVRKNTLDSILQR